MGVMDIRECLYAGGRRGVQLFKTEILMIDHSE
jgi:hypothetical protein